MTVKTTALTLLSLLLLWRVAASADDAKHTEIPNYGTIEAISADGSTQDCKVAFKIKAGKEPIGIWTTSGDLVGKMRLEDASGKEIPTTPEGKWRVRGEYANKFLRLLEPGKKQNFAINLDKLFVLEPGELTAHFDIAIVLLSDVDMLRGAPETLSCTAKIKVRK